MTGKSLDKAKLNIAMLGHKRIPSREGGVEVVVEELATRMVERGHKVTCYNRSGHHVSGAEYETNSTREAVTKGEYKGVTLKTVWTINRRGFAAMTSSLFGATRAAFGKYDVVHIHAEGPSAMCWLPRVTGKKVIVTIHGLDWQRAKWGKVASSFIMAGERGAVRHADEIIVLSRGLQKYFKEVYNRDTVFIPNGVCRPKVRKARKITERWGLKEGSYVLFLGRLVPEKGVEYLIDAWRGIKTDKKLVIAGGSSDTKRYMNKLRANSPDNVIFTGFIQGRVLEELYSNSYVYCLPSDVEGMPLSLLEAMSYGNCCLVSDISECTEVVEDKAAVFKQGDVRDLRTKLQELIDNPDRVAAYRKEAADFICGKYNWDDVVDKTLALYRGEFKN